MTVTKNAFGYIVITDVVNGQLFERMYQGWPRSQCVRDFKRQVLTEKRLMKELEQHFPQSLIEA